MAFNVSRRDGGSHFQERLERLGWPVVVGVAVGEDQAPHPLGIQGCENLSDAAAAVIADHVDLVDLQCVKHLSQHVGVGGHGDVLPWLDLGIAMCQQVYCDTAANIG